MINELAAVVYNGVRYPVTHEVAVGIIDRIEGFAFNTLTDFVQIPTTDGREVVLRVGQALPIAFESKRLTEDADLQSQ